jgi:hypothetical protein
LDRPKEFSARSVEVDRPGLEPQTNALKEGVDKSFQKVFKTTGFIFELANHLVVFPSVCCLSFLSALVKYRA